MDCNQPSIWEISRKTYVPAPRGRIRVDGTRNQRKAMDPSMRKVVLYELLSLDGVPEEPGDWMSDSDQPILLLVAAHRDSTAARPANAHTEETAS